MNSMFRKTVEESLENIKEVDEKLEEQLTTNFEQDYEREDSDTGFAENKAEATFLRALRKYDVFANNLLGTFDENGKYSIPKEILLELVSMKKLIGLKTEQGIELSAPYKENITFRFLLEIKDAKPEDEQRETNLYLLETISKVNGYIQNIMSTLVATYSYKNVEAYEDYVYRAFHVVKNIDDPSDGALDGDANYIDARLKYLETVKQASKDKYIELEENYFNTRMQILNEIPQGAIILSEFNKKRAQLDKFFIDKNRNKFRALNELLTSILEANPQILASMPTYTIMITTLNTKYLGRVNEISVHIKNQKEYIELKQAMQQTREEVVVKPAPRGVAVGGKKPAAKAKENAKGGGGKKKSASKSKDGGGGGGKKKGGDKKKDDKKKDDKKKKKALGGKPSPITAAETKTQTASTTPDISRQLDKGKFGMDKDGMININTEKTKNLGSKDKTNISKGRTFTFR